jgi:hypothetical protein
LLLQIIPIALIFWTTSGVIHGDFLLPIRFFLKGACLSRICVKLVSHTDHITLGSSDELISFQSTSFKSFKNSLSLKCLKCRLRVNEFANCLCQIDLRTKYISEWSLILSDRTPETFILSGVFVIQRSSKDCEVLVTLYDNDWMIISKMGIDCLVEFLTVIIFFVLRRAGRRLSFLAASLQIKFLLEPVSKNAQIFNWY